MMEDELHPKLLTVRQLFDNDTIYTVPIYQRNFAWKAEHIVQLISDVQDAMQGAVIGAEHGYYLGTLVVTKRELPQTSRNDFWVVDGQQRLTTLYLLLTVLEQELECPFGNHTGLLQYESRARATEALRRVRQEPFISTRQSQDPVSSEDSGIHEGFKHIRQFIKQHYFRKKDELREFADFLQDKVKVVRTSLPQRTDLNRYFEIMNTRGQQLKQVDIVKARLMSVLADDAEHSCFAWIWDACADMDSYVQMSLTPGRQDLREKIFGPEWSFLELKDFKKLSSLKTPIPKLPPDAPPQAVSNPAKASSGLPLDAALFKYARATEEESGEDNANERFRSIIEFPAFLLHVLKVQNSRENEDEGELDDKQLIKLFNIALTDARSRGQEPGEWARDFAFTLLKCRNLFDGFILKRQFTTRTEDEVGDWSLRCLRKRRYIHTFSKTEAEEYGEADSDTDVLLLQSMLRITYTSPRTMHWITEILQWLAKVSKPSDITSSALAEKLRNYARRKVRAAFFDRETHPEEPQGFAIERVVFAYLDYVLLDKLGKERWRGFKFQFRNSIEHFYPQHPDEEQSGATVSKDNLDRLGNLALVSVAANSKFSNSLPKVKAENFKDTIKQSPKLWKMAEIIREAQSWGDHQVESHHDEMRKLLLDDVNLRIDVGQPSTSPPENPGSGVVLP